MKKTHHAPNSTVKPFSILRPFQEFFQLQASGGILLLACAIIALLWANSPASGSYHSLWQTEVSFKFSSFSLTKPLLLWINDGLMAIFFFLVGLEIKREILVGEMASARRAAFPIAAALGGLLTPALIYIALNRGGENANGWGVPIATDIAFALGILALLGSRVPLSLKIFLTALAIVDDICAVLVIAVFYTDKIVWDILGLGIGVLALLIIANRIGVRHSLVYIVLGVMMWVFFLKSGVHATIAGVLLAMTIPVQTRINPLDFLRRSRNILDEFEHANDEGDTILTNETQQAALHTLEVNAEAVQAPLLRMEHALHAWVSFLIMPLFALANAGVALEGDIGATLTDQTTLGVILGLVFGKPIGITLFSWLAVRTRLADKPADLSWRQINAVGWLAGIGFTMSLFISNLAFDAPSAINAAKLGILVASVLAGISGWVLLSLTNGRQVNSTGTTTV